MLYNPSIEVLRHRKPVWLHLLYKPWNGSGQQIHLKLAAYGFDLQQQSNTHLPLIIVPVSPLLLLGVATGCLAYA
jgi:hypothetical protein